MVTQISMPSSAQGTPSATPLNTPEFIDRLATELRSQGDVDLPHSYYVEQVKLRLAGQTPAEPASERTPAPYESSDCFRAWALGE
ncbi:hypothetical protein [Allorhizobium borbori]|uniref:Uncharacterized protein n=1 Tax=Allorhizobium borbori TaxID=485907 RepID=A0A7W6P3C8_9HYPH|nr:hypothetical protein [Allorhizobium borbori]MBB4104724.1 hypothetical protein [Allorhizobium borbori]PZU23524.1 MAG: hypothetical protein DI589_07550 [Shinella sp.]